MNVKLVSLELVFKQATVDIPFSTRLTFVHGQVGTGKSSIARLIDWCLGDDMDFTPRLNDELVSAGLRLEVGSYLALIVRDREDKTHVRLSFTRDGAEPENRVVPIKTTGADWDPRTPETLSDYLFVLAGLTPLRVPKSRKKADTKLERLSFRDFLAFCYLPQENLNVSLLRFGEPHRERKSADVMRALLGLFSERQQRLQAESDALLRESNKLRLQADEVATFLDRLEIDRGDDLDEQYGVAEREFSAAKAARAQIDRDRLPKQHPSERLRERLRALDKDIASRHGAIADVDERMERDGRLRAELITAQLKLERSATAVEVLAGVTYKHCPQCGSPVASPDDPDNCHLCKTATSPSASPLPIEAARSDLQDRIEELAASLERHRSARGREARRLHDIEKERESVDRDLVEMLRDYDSKRLAAVKDVERRLGAARTVIERLSTARRLRKEVARLLSESARLAGERAPILDELKSENARLAERERYRDVIAAAFHEALLAVGMPDFQTEDTVVITDEMEPIVEPASGQSAYGFRNVGSSGMKTLFQCCYALALHRVAAEHDLLLPRFLVIDTPTQHVDERVDPELFHGFFRYVYELMQGPMSTVQVILIDKDLERPPAEIEFEPRLMNRHDPDHPRLIPYGYRAAPAT